MSGRAWVVVIVSGVAGFALALGIGACGEDEGGSVTIEGGTTGATGTVGTTTAPVTVDTTASDPAQLGAAMGEIEDYARGQTAELVTATRRLRAAVEAGNVAAAKRAYAAGRPYYERIEPLVALFPELDGKIDAREDDFPKKARDPAWTGFHPIERMLWKDGEITARTGELARRLVVDSERLDELMRGAEVTPEVVIPGTAELVDEVEESKITGEEERYSKLDLPTFLANLEGSQEFYEALEPLVDDQGRRAERADRGGFRRGVHRGRGAQAGRQLRGLRRPDHSPAARDQAADRGARRAAGPRAGHARRELVTSHAPRASSRGRRPAALPGSRSTGSPTAADDEAAAQEGLLEWRGSHQAGIVTPRTAYGVVAAFDVVDDDLPALLQDLTLRIGELTQGWPDRLDPIENADLPPSDTGELGYERRNEGRLTITLGLGASLFDRRFGLRGQRPPALSRMPSFPGDNLDPDRCHGDLLLLVQSDHMMVTHHALRDVMRRTKGRLQGRWAQPCFQRFAAHHGSTRRRPGVADARGLLGFPDGSQNIGVDQEGLIFAGSEAPEWARGGSYLAVRLIRLKLERWDRLTRTDQERSIGRDKLSGAPIGGEKEEETPTLDRRTPVDAHIRMANPRGPGDEQRRFLRRPFVYANGFDDYGLLESGSVFLAFCRDLEKQFATVKRRTRLQDLDEYMVAVGGGYFFCPPGVAGGGDYLARRLVEA